MTNSYYEALALLDEAVKKVPLFRDFFVMRKKDIFYSLDKALSDVYGEDDCPFYMESGLTKAVFIFQDYGVVFKVPFSNTGIDYCKLEAENYRYAKAVGLEKFFAPCVAITNYYVCNMDGIDIPVVLYVMNYVDVNEDLNCEYYCQSELYDEDDMDSSQFEVARIFSNYYDDGEISELLSFMTDYNINDIHDGNVGALEDKSPVLIDYSGYSGYFN